MLFLLNLILLQWTSYRLGWCVSTKDWETNVGWVLTGPYWPMTGFPMLGKIKAIYPKDVIYLWPKPDGLTPGEDFLVVLA